MAISIPLTIGGVDRSANVQEGSLFIVDNLWARNTMNLDLRDDMLSYRPVVGQPVVMLDTDGITRLFAGSIDSIDETYYNGPQPFRTYKLAIADPSQVCDRHLVVESFIDPAQTLQDIVTFINDNYLTGEGVDDTNVAVGPVIPETKLFNYRTVTDVFNELSTLTNYVWWIDYYNKLYFIAKSANVNPTDLTYANTIQCTVTRSRALGPYRNRQYVRAGTAMTDSRTEHLVGDGARRTFNTTFDVERTPTVVLNGFTQTVGIHGLDTGKAFYWNRGSNQIVQDDTGVVLTGSDDLAVTYIGRYPISVQAQIDEEIAARAAIEGGSGVYESLKTDRNLNDLEASQNLAQSLLDRYAFIPDNLTVITDTTGYRSGQLVHCDFPANDILGDYLISSVRAQVVSASFLRYTINLTSFLST